MLNDVNQIIEIINKNDKDAYLVGGAVRDMVLGKTPHDYDIATNMSYEDLEKVFPDNYPSGKAFGIVTIFFNNTEYEIAHFRNDGEYSDNRHCEVELVETIDEDLKRRDFTINAMAWNEKDGIIDLFNGKNDIENKIIRSVGNPNERFNEDALRMLRAIRFAAQLGFTIEENTYNAIIENAHLIQNVSYERIEAELTKILTSKNPEMIKLLCDTGISKYIFPELDALFACEQNNPNHMFDVGTHTMVALKNIKNDKILRWTMLLHDIGKPDTKTTKDGIDHFYDHAEVGKLISRKILKRFKFSNEEREQIEDLIKQHDINIKKKNKLRLYAAKKGAKFFDNLLLVQLSDISAQSDYNKDKKIEKSYTLNKNIHEVIDDKTAIALNDLKINGEDLLKLGYKGEEIGAILKDIYTICLANPEFNDRQKLLEKAKSYKRQSLDDIIKQYRGQKRKISKSEELER